MREDAIKRVFGLKLRNLRKRKGITQELLANQASLKRTSITNMEKGRQSLSLPALYALAEALDVEVYDLLPSRLELEEQQVAESKVAHVDDSERADVLEWVDVVTRRSEK